MKYTFEHYKSVDSTNERIKERAEQGAEEGLVISAAEQTKGKGRRGRIWQSEPEGSVAASILLRPGISIDRAAAITTAASVAAARVCGELTGERVYIKWPNDIIISDRKVCGILCETGIENGNLKYIIVGIGINVHQKSFPAELEDKAISLDMAKKHNEHISRRTVIEKLLEQFDHVYTAFLETGDMSRLKEEYEARFISMNRPVYVMEGNVAVECIAMGIDSDGALLVSNDGCTKRINSGEVSVRGIYGYV